jgi:hypothetical protein
VAQGLAAQGFSAPCLLFAAFPFVPFSAFLSVLTAQGFFAAQGFWTAQGFFAAQGFVWAKIKLGASKNAAATKGNIKRTTFSFIKPSFFTASCG